MVPITGEISGNASFIPTNEIYNPNTKSYTITGFPNDIGLVSTEDRQIFDSYYNDLRQKLITKGIKLEMINSSVAKLNGSLNFLTLPRIEETKK